MKYYNRLLARKSEKGQIDRCTELTYLRDRTLKYLFGDEDCCLKIVNPDSKRIRSIVSNNPIYNSPTIGCFYIVRLGGSCRNN